jgi:hypothetical protein
MPLALAAAALGAVGCGNMYDCIEGDHDCEDSVLVSLVTSTLELPYGHYEVRIEADGEAFTCASDETGLSYPETSWTPLACSGTGVSVAISLHRETPISFRIELWQRTPDVVAIELDIPHRPTFAATAAPSYEEVEGCGHTCQDGFAEVAVP